MKAIAIIRSFASESLEDQQKRLHAYAMSEDIEITHTVIREMWESDFVDVENALPSVDVVLVTDVSRITRSTDRLDEFKKLLEKHNVRLITLAGE